MIQTTRFTSAAVALMHIINSFNKDFILSKENEFRIWQSSVNLPTRSCSIYGLAAFAKEQGVNAKVVVEKHEYSFELTNADEERKEEINNAKFFSFLHQKKARELGIDIEERPFSFDDVKNALNEGKIVLLRLNKQAFFGYRPEASYFAVLRYDEDNSTFQIIDPRQGEIEVDEERLDEAFETLKTKCRRDPRMILFW